MRSTVHLALALLLALTSQTLASARGQVMVVGVVVICSGGQLVTLHVDASGQPVEAPHVCPDCALHALAGLTAADPDAVHATGTMDLRPPLSAPAAPAAAPLDPRARAPPATA
jgi:hypothetical protein